MDCYFDMDFGVTQRPNPTLVSGLPDINFDQLLDFDVWELLTKDDDDHGGGVEGSPSQSIGSSDQNLTTDHQPCHSSTAATASSSACRTSIKCKEVVKRSGLGPEQKVAFRTKSKIDVMDDGYKWRKYGKKAVKDSPNPRNYYKCSNEGCQVKKRIQRDRGDPEYIITTYHGVHNHESPCLVYYYDDDDHDNPLVPNKAFTLQPAASSLPNS